MNKTLLSFATAAFALGGVASAYGATVYCNQVGGYYPGIYTFPSEGGTLEKVFEYNGLDSKYAGVFTDAAYYSSFFAGSYNKYCIRVSHNGAFAEWQTPSRINDKLKTKDIPTALAWNSLSGKIYGSFLNDDQSSWSFGTFSVTDGTSTIIAPLAKQLVSLAVNENGEMFAIDSAGDLSSINAAGEMQLIGSTGVTPSPKYSAGAAFDPDSGILYWAVTTKGMDTILHTVDTATGAATPVYTFPDNTNLTALIIPASPSPEGAPADVEDFLALPDGFDDKLNITFTLPSKTLGGEDMLGAVKYKVMVDTEVIADTQGGPGNPVSLSCAPGAGEHTVTLFISNAAGKGHRIVSKIFIGKDTPGAVTSLAISVDNKTISLSWDAPVAGEHGGNFDVEALRYDVVRDNDGQKVAEGISETSFSETIESAGLAKYSYTVTPVCGDLTGPSAKSDAVLVGDGMKPPYEQAFEGIDAFDEIYFSTFDGNDDGSGWTIYSNYYTGAGNARYNYSSDNDADDWLFTCPLVLEAGHRYEVSFTLNCGRWGNGERLGVSYGHLPEESSMEYTALPDTDYEKGFNDKVTTYVEPVESGTYYLGFHITSQKDSFNVDLDNIRIEAGVPTGVGRNVDENIGVRALRGELEVFTGRTVRVSVINAAGAVVAGGVCASGVHKIQLNSGIYVVMVDGRSYKVLVK